MASKPKTTPLFLLTLLLFTLHYLTHLHRGLNPAPPPPPRNPRWFDAIARHLRTKNINIGLVNTDPAAIRVHTEGNIVQVHFDQVGRGVQWSHLFPEWIDEGAPANCPEIPLAEPEKYGQLDVVVAGAPCGTRDVRRLQVNLVVANLVAWSGAHGAVFAVFVGPCGPMWEIFRCDDLVVRVGRYWVYRPEIWRMKQVVDMPVGSCRLSPPPPVQLGKGTKQPREAFATILHSSEAYVCGAIALAQSIIQSNSTKDLLLLADDRISPPSLAALRSAGWKIHRICRIRNPHAAKNAYNEWNYSKLRLWQIRRYDKLVFIDSDLIVARNLDHLFAYPQISAVGNDGHVFNSGVMLVEPSACTFEALMKRRWAVRSYNGGDQGFLNEMFPWWHRLPSRVNRLKFFGAAKDDEHRIKEDVYAVHYLGLKPWMCYRDYDCNWDQAETRKFASDSANAKWWRVYDGMSEELRRHCALAPEMEARIRKYRSGAENAGFPDGHWKMVIRDPRQNIR